MARMNAPPQTENRIPILEAIGCALSPCLPLSPGFELPTREAREGRTVSNMCGRDFFWLCLHRQNPKRWNLRNLPPAEVTWREIFGPNVWPVTGLHLSRVPNVLADEGLALAVNGYPVLGYRDLVAVTVCRGPHRTADALLGEIHELVTHGVSCGINLPVSFCGLVSHLMFVVGFVDEGLVVLDTHLAPGINYRKRTPDGDSRCAMYLSFREVTRCWRIRPRGARVFSVTRTAP